MPGSFARLSRSKFEIYRDVFLKITPGSSEVIFGYRKHLLQDIRLRAVSLFSLSVEQKAQATRVTEGARREISRVSRFRHSTLARACTPLTEFEEKERLLAVY